LISTQEQPGKQPYIGLLGGMLENREDFIEGAKRELLEESGYTFKTYEILMAERPVSKMDFVLHILIVKDCKKIAEQHLDRGEKI